MLDIYLNLAVRGLSTGAIYSLVAMAIVLIFQTTGVMNFAQGNAGMFLTYIAFFLLSLKLPYPIVILIIILLGSLFGGLTENVLMKKVRERSHVGLLMITLGLALIFEGLAAFIFGSFPLYFPPILTGSTLNIGPIILGSQDVIIIVLSVIIFSFLFIVLYKTKIGIAARSISEDEYGSRILGIPVSKIYILIWAIGLALAGFAGVLVVPRFSLEPHFMVPIQIKAFTAAVLGGMNSVLGAIIGGLLLGILENIVAFNIPILKESFSLILVVVVLLFLPNGLFGKKSQRRF